MSWHFNDRTAKPPRQRDNPSPEENYERPARSKLQKIFRAAAAARKPPPAAGKSGKIDPHVEKNCSGRVFLASKAKDYRRGQMAVFSRNLAKDVLVLNPDHASAGCDSYFALFASLGPAAQSMPQPGRLSCCAAMKMNATQNDCGKQMPKSQQDRSCCDICFVALDLFVSPAAPLPKPSAVDELFAVYTVRDCSGSERRPIPPPRAPVV